MADWNGVLHFNDMILHDDDHDGAYPSGYSRATVGAPYGEGGSFPAFILLLVRVLQTIYLCVIACLKVVPVFHLLISQVTLQYMGKLNVCKATQSEYRIPQEEKMVSR